MVKINVDNILEDVKKFQEDVKRITKVKQRANGLTQLIFAKPLFRGRTSKDDDNRYSAEYNRAKDANRPNKSERAFLETVLRKHEDFVLSNLKDQEYKMLVGAMEKFQVQEGDTIIEQDDVGDFLYVLESGSIQYLKDGEEIGTASDSGEVFGELALLYECPRAATVLATSPCSLYRVSRETFRTIQASFILENQNETRKFLQDSALFNGLPEHILRQLAECMKKKEYGEGEILVKRGEDVDEIFFVKEGRLQGRDIRVGEREFADRVLQPGDHFGERAIVMDEGSALTVECLTDVVVYVLTKERFLHCLQGIDIHETIENRLDAKVLYVLPFIAESDICRIEIFQMVEKLTKLTLEPGEVLATIGEEVEPALYFVATKNKDSGYVECIESDGTITKHGPSQPFSFGKHTLIASNIHEMDGKAAANYGKENKLLRLDKEEGVESAIRDLLERNVVTAQMTVRAQGTAPVHIRKLSLLDFKKIIHDPLRLGRYYQTKLSREDAHETLGPEKLEKRRLLGQGTFGQVWLCREPSRDLPYALKIQYKRELIVQHQAAGVVRESNIMRKMHHPFVAGLVHAEQDPTCLYMVMQLFPGGELRSRMRNETKAYMEESEAKFYAAGMLEGLSYMHRREYVYRDLKGENVLLDKDGYCVIVDLGFAKHVPDKTFTFCGTPIFIAPEVLLNKGYDKSADIWSWGIMIYEMLFGTNPFFDYDDPTIDQRTLFKRVVGARFQRPVKQTALDAYKKVSEEAKDLIKKVLVVKPYKRLGCLPGADLDIRKHPWFADIDWGKLYRKELQAPWVPTVRDPFDGSNFKETVARPKTGMRPLSNWEQEQFEEFC